MKQWIRHAWIAGALAGCMDQPVDTVPTALQATCPSPTKYPNAKLPKLLDWNGTLQHPDKDKGQTLLSFQNPNVPGESLILIVDPVTGTVPWGARFKTVELGKVRTSASVDPWIDFSNRPPPPPPPPIGDGWLAAFAVGLVVDVGGAIDRATAINLAPIK